MTGKVPASWWVYMLRTAEGHLYTGISTDPLRRLAQHASGKRGARSLRGRGPLQLVWIEAAADRSTASRREAALKKLDKTAKERLVASGSTGGISMDDRL
ncbi:MAG TPA: GIY-YIG nuclease family protein [Pseudomonadaceae bacterium]|nr:GIY-YIG nuclease family protein [Pseudomonadaceae bacterium]